MWTLLTSIDFRAARQRMGRTVVGATVVVGSLTHAAMLLYPTPAAACPEPAALAATDAPAATVSDADDSAPT